VLAEPLPPGVAAAAWELITGALADDPWRVGKPLHGPYEVDALIGAFSTEYRCEQPGDDEVLRRVRSYSGDALENLATAEAVPTSDVPMGGLTILSALAQLCRSESPSALQRAA
jgi:hypothetical protein